MSIFAPTRIVSIKGRLNVNQKTIVLLTASPVTLAGTAIPYDIRIHSLKGLGFIRNQPYTLVPVDNPSDSSLKREMKAIQYAQSPRVGVQFTIRDDSNNGEFLNCQPIPFYNNGGLHEVNISQVLSDLTEYGLESGHSLIARAIDLGYGEINGGDEIHITGFATRSGEFLQDSQESLYTVP